MPDTAPSLTPNQVRFLKSEAHKLEPAAKTSVEGYSAAFVKEVIRQLELSELIKVRLEADDRRAFAACAARLAEECGAALVETIGRVAMLYRPAAVPRLVLPAAREPEAH
jgi:RNA-binding protein